MKRILWLTLAICSLFLSSCQKDHDTVTLMAEMENYSSGSKVYLDNENFACWEVDDSVKINLHDYYISMSSNTNQGAYIKEVNFNQNGYTAAYPGDKATCVNKNKKVTFNGLDSLFKIREWDSKKNKSNLMVACTNSGTGNLVFKNVGAIIKIDITNTKTNEPLIINNWTLTLSSTQPLWRENVTVNPNNANISNKSGASFKNVSSQINATIAKGGTKSFYVNVLPVTGAVFTVKIMNGQTEVFNKTTKSLSLSKNQIGTLPIKLDVSTPIADPGLLPKEGDYYILSDDNALKILENPATYPFYSDKKLKIQLTSGTFITIKASDNWNGIGNPDMPFVGTFDGNNVPIYINNNVSKAIINNVGDNAIITKVYREIGGGITCHDVSTGGIVGAVSGKNVTISECTNVCAIKGENLNKESYIGGVCGYVDATSDNFTLQNCVNRGEEVVGTAGNFEIYLGGLCGKIDAPNAKLINNVCSVNGESQIKFRTNGNKGGKVGGIVGQMSNYFTMDGCINHSDIQSQNYIDASLDTKFQIGGLIGASVWNSTESVKSIIKNSNNEGILDGQEAGGLVGYGKAIEIENCKSIGTFQKDNISGFFGVLEGLSSSNKLKIKNSQASLYTLNNKPRYGISRMVIGQSDSTDNSYYEFIDVKLGNDPGNNRVFGNKNRPDGVSFSIP